jgi:putative oligomerization/nucleic acid binding protein
LCTVSACWVTEYRQTGKLLSAFKVNVADVTGFSVREVTRQDKKNGAGALQQMLILQGSGQSLRPARSTTELRRRSRRGSERIRLFLGTSPQNAAGAAPPVSIADELVKLAQLRDSGVLSPDEFAQAKAKLLDYRD